MSVQDHLVYKLLHYAGALAVETGRCMYVVRRDLNEACCRDASESSPRGLSLCQRHLEQVEQWSYDRVYERLRVDEVEHELRSGYIYYVRRGDGAVKIGTTCDVESRMKNLARQHGYLVLLAQHGGTRRTERILHSEFADIRLEGEWFRYTGDLAIHIEKVNKQGNDAVRHMWGR